MTHKLITLALLLLLAIPAEAQHRVEVTLQSAKLISNNKVGNEWSTAVYAGAPHGTLTQLERYGSTTFETSGDLLIKVQVVEDEKYPDYGEASQVVRLAELPAGKPLAVTLDVVVREDRGRYRGNTAKWRFEVQVVRK